MKKIIASALIYAGTTFFFGGITCFAFSENLFAGITMIGIDFLIAALIVILNKSIDE